MFYRLMDVFGCPTISKEGCSIRRYTERTFNYFRHFKDNAA